MENLVFISCTSVARYMIIEILENPAIKNVQISGIINLNTKRSMSKANYDSYSDLVEKYNLPIHYCNNVNDTFVLDWIRDKEPALIIQSGWSQKFKKELLEIPRFGCIGEHPAPLPRGRGAACVNWAILNGESDWGDTFFKMELEYDKGAILAQNHFRIENYDTVETVYDKVSVCGQQVMREYIDEWIQGNFEVTNQDEKGATYFTRRKPSDGLFSFKENALSIYNAIRAQTRPYPGAFFVYSDGYSNREVKVWEAQLIKNTTAINEVGIIDISLDGGGVAVTCGDGNKIILLRVQEFGKPVQWAKEWIVTNCITKL